MDNLIAISDINLAGSLFKSYEVNFETMIISLSGTNGENFKIVFQTPIQFSFKKGKQIQGLFQSTKASPLLNEALLLRYVHVPEVHPFRPFQLLDMSDLPFIEVIAESATIIEDQKP